MIQVISSDNQHLYPKQLEQMFRMRHEYYVLGHGWSGLSSENGRETDEFDDEHAVYLVSVDLFGEVAASLRLNPSLGPTLLKKFSHYAHDDLPQSEACWDLSRWIARPDQRRANHTRWPTNHQRELALGVLEFCQSRGLDCLTMLCETRLAERIKAYGWPVTFLGEPQDYEGGKGSAVAARIDTGQHLLAMTHQKTGILHDVLVELPPANFVAPAANSEELQALVQSIGADQLRSLVNLLARRLSAGPAEDRAGAIELLGSFNRMLETAGAGLDLIAQLQDALPVGADDRSSGIPTGARSGS